MLSRRVKFVLIAVVLFIAVQGVFAQEYLPELVRRVKPSAVSIETFDARGNSLSRGSGFFVGYDRIITNRHVIEKASRVDVHLMDGKKFSAKGVLAVDGEGDIALLQVEVPRQLAAPLQIVRTTPQEGESIVVIGNPFGLEGSVSNGIVSAVRDISGYGRIIQITAPISPGSSGSPVVNMAGQVIGIATLQASEGQSLNFAVPSERILRLKVGELQSLNALSENTLKNKRAAAERYYSQGVALLSRDEFAKALANFEKAIEADPNYAEAWYQAGYAYGLLGRHTDSLAASRQVVKLRPDWGAAYINIGASSIALSKFEDALAAYRRAAQLVDDNADIQYAIGFSLGKLNRNDEEILAYRRALAINPDHPLSTERIAAAYLKQRKFGDAVQYLERLNLIKPESSTFLSLGEAYLELGKIEESLDALNNAVVYDPEAGQARYHLGRALIKKGDKEMARVQYEILRNSRSEWADRLLVLLDQ